ncbi:MAG: glutamate 5-kinase [Phycisphaerae bacterium]|nr:glutamate 5-kinase [Phycisphaerae bacterium]
MRDFTESRRIVIKVGTNTLTKGTRIDGDYVRRLAGQVTHLRTCGKQVVIVTSGAIGMGAMQLGLAGPIKEMRLRQACAAVGQPLLMAEYRKAFQRVPIHVGQVLLTADVLDHRQTYLNLRNAIEALLDQGVIPILNENDSVSTDEIGSAFGDNDRLSALVASKIDADLLIILSDVDALYDKDPREFPDAQPIRTVHEITDPIVKAAGGKGSTHATGGMKTKIAAARIAAQAGCRVVLAHGREKDVVRRIVAGEPIGTIFLPKRRLSNRARWILNSQSAGVIRVDEGAIRAICNHKSLLPSGITAVEGPFEAGSVVMINERAKAVTSLSSAQLEAVAGRHSTEIARILGPDHRDVVATPEDIVLID